MFLLIDSGASRIVSHSAAKRFSDVCTLSDRQTAAQNIVDVRIPQIVNKAEKKIKAGEMVQTKQNKQNKQN